MIENLKARVRMFNRDLISLDDLGGYLQCLHDMNMLTAEDVITILYLAMNHDERIIAWAYGKN